MSASLDALARDPALADSLSPQERLRTIVTLAALATALAARSAAQPEAAVSERLLTIKEAAPRVGLHPATLYKRARRDPRFIALTVNNGTSRLLFSPAKIADFVAGRTVNG